MCLTCGLYCSVYCHVLRARQRHVGALTQLAVSWRASCWTTMKRTEQERGETINNAKESESETMKLWAWEMKPLGDTILLVMRKRIELNTSEVNRKVQHWQRRWRALRRASHRRLCAPRRGRRSTCARIARDRSATECRWFASRAAACCRARTARTLFLVSSSSRAQNKTVRLMWDWWDWINYAASIVLGTS